MAKFLRENPRLDKKTIGDYIGDKKNGRILEAFVRYGQYLRDLKVAITIFSNVIFKHSFSDSFESILLTRMLFLQVFPFPRLES